MLAGSTNFEQFTDPTMSRPKIWDVFNKSETAKWNASDKRQKKYGYLYFHVASENVQLKATVATGF
jgi:hypothetical protein